MATHPINLMLRFLLEIAAITAVGIWGWKLGQDWSRFLWAFTFPVLLMVTWGVFAVPQDPSRSGKAPIAVSGWLRLLIELGIFSIATWVLHDLGFMWTSMVFGIICLLHYIASYDRVQWLIRK